MCDEVLSPIGFEGREDIGEPAEELPLDDLTVFSEPAVVASSSVFDAMAETLDMEPVQLAPVVDVLDTSVLPFRIVAHLRMTINGRTFDGTAFFVTNSVLLTAGHNLFFHNFGASPAITVYPGRNGNRGYGTFVPRAFHPSDGWLARDVNADYGIIALSAPLALGTFGVIDVPAGPPPTVRISGYPSARPLGTQSTGVGPMAAGPSRIRYGVETLDGQSGGPLIVNGTRTVIGVHVARLSGPAEAIRLTSSVRADINSLLQRL